MIVDASVAFKWIFVEDGSAAANELLARVELHAPTLLLIEISNALWKKGRRGELADHPAFAQQLRLVASLVSIVDAADFTPRALELALQIDHPVYDCVYLAMAEHFDEPLVSADARFIAKLAGTSYAPLVQALQ